MSAAPMVSDLVMSLSTLEEILLDNMQGLIHPAREHMYYTKEAALEKLRAMTGQDFGYDTKAWVAWLKANTKTILSPRYKKMEDE